VKEMVFNLLRIREVVRSERCRLSEVIIEQHAQTADCSTKRIEAYDRLISE